MKSQVIRTISLLGILGAWLLTGCETENNVTGGGSAANLSVPASVSLTDVLGDGDERTFTVESNGYWMVSAIDQNGLTPSWITLSPATGSGNGEVTVAFARNTSASRERSATICVMLRSEAESVMLPVQQGRASFTTGFQPIINIFEYQNGDKATDMCRNGSIDDSKTVFTFADSGAKITTVGAGDLQCTFASNFYKPYISASGWDAENAAWVISMPVTAELVGTLSFGFGMLSNSSSNCAVPRDWKVEWSTDNASWSDIDAFYNWNGSSQCPTESSVSEDKSVSMVLAPNINSDAYYHKMAVFTVPAEKAIQPGSTLYIRIAGVGSTPIKGTAYNADHRVRFPFGFVLAQYERGSYHTRVLPSEANVVLAEGFDSSLSGMDYMAGIGHLAYVTGSLHEPADGWTMSGTVTDAIGYVRLAANATLTTPALAALGSTPTDITVTFNATVRCASNNAIAKRAIAVAVAEGDGTIEVQPDSESVITTVKDCFEWHTFTVQVKGATAATRLKFSNTDQWFLDEVVITK